MGYGERQAAAGRVRALALGGMALGGLLLEGLLLGACTDAMVGECDSWVSRLTSDGYQTCATDDDAALHELWDFPELAGDDIDLVYHVGSGDSYPIYGIIGSPDDTDWIGFTSAPLSIVRLTVTPQVHASSPAPLLDVSVCSDVCTYRESSGTIDFVGRGAGLSQMVVAELFGSGSSGGPGHGYRLQVTQIQGGPTELGLLTAAASIRESLTVEPPGHVSTYAFDLESDSMRPQVLLDGVEPGAELVYFREDGTDVAEIDADVWRALSSTRRLFAVRIDDVGDGRAVELEVRP